MGAKELWGHGLAAGLAACLFFPPGVSASAPVDHDTAIAWSHAIETFFQSPSPDLSTLSEVVPPLSRLDLGDPAVRVSLERVTQQIGAVAEKLAPAGSENAAKAPAEGQPDADQLTATLEKLEVLRAVFGAHLTEDQRARVHATFQAFRGRLAEGRRAQIDARMKGLADYLQGSPRVSPPEHRTPPVDSSSPPPSGSDDVQHWHSRSDLKHAVAINYVNSYTETHARGDIANRIQKQPLARTAMDHFIEESLNAPTGASKRTGPLDHTIPLPKGSALEAGVLADFLAHVGSLIPTKEGSPPRFNRNGIQPDGTKFYWNYVVKLNSWGAPKIEVQLTESRREREHTLLLSWDRSSEKEVRVRLHIHPAQQGGMGGLTIWQTIRLSENKLALFPVDVSWPLSSSAEYAVARLRPGFTLHHPAVSKLLEMTARFIAEIAGAGADIKPAL